MKTTNCGRDISTHELAIAEIERVSKINEELVNTHNTHVIMGARAEARIRELEQERDRNLQSEAALEAKP